MAHANAGGGGATESEEYRLLVAVRNPGHVSQLMRTATDLARMEGGSIHVVSVITKSHDSPFGIFDDETIRNEFAGDRKEILDRSISAGEGTGVDVGGSVAVARRVSNGILDTAATIDADGLLIGWDGTTSRSDAVLGSTIDAMIERAPCDVFVERIGTLADGVSSVLVPVAGSPHASLAVRAGCAIATGNESRLCLVSVAAGGVDHRTAERNLEMAAETLDGIDIGRDVAVEMSVIDAEDVVEALVEEAPRHDVVSMGATRGGTLRRRLIGSIPLRVTNRIEPAVLLSRRWTGPSKVTQLLGRLRRSS